LGKAKDLLGQADQSINVLEFVRLDTCRGKLRLDEAEPDSQLLLIIGAKLDLSGSCPHDVLTTVSFRQFSGKSKVGAAQAMEGNFSQEE
jgi:hypothetical protein